MADSQKRSETPRVNGHADDIEAQLQAALRALGLQIPLSDDEVRQAEIELVGSGVELPAALRDHNFLWNQDDCTAASDSIRADFNANEQTEQNLARAAREGRAISEEIEARMRRDREDAEKSKNERK